MGKTSIVLEHQDGRVVVIYHVEPPVKVFGTQRDGAQPMRLRVSTQTPLYVGVFQELFFIEVLQEGNEVGFLPALRQDCVESLQHGDLARSKTGVVYNVDVIESCPPREAWGCPRLCC